MQYTRIAATTVAAISSIVLVASLSGCASGAGSSVSVGSAKQQTIAYEQEIAAFVPAKYVISTNVAKTSRVIFPCLGKKIRPAHGEFHRAVKLLFGHAAVVVFEGNAGIHGAAIEMIQLFELLDNAVFEGLGEGNVV